MQNYFLMCAAFLFGVLTYLISMEWVNRNIVKTNWPADLSKKIKVEYWILESCGEGEQFRIRNKTLLLYESADFFKKRYVIPEGCNENDPIVVVDDMDKPDGNQRILTKSNFDLKYSRYKAFNSYREYSKYLDSEDFPT